MQVFEEDGRVFVKRALRREARYDIVMLDAFEDEYIPEHLSTREFLTEVKGLLTADGVVAANTFSGNTLYPYESATYADVFGDFYNLKLGNRVIWAQPGGLVGIEALRANAKQFEAFFDARGFSADWLLAIASTRRDWPADTRLLTDQYSPSNILNAR